MPLNLPLELIRAIMAHLSFEDILSLMRSCRHLSYLVCEPQLEHYRTRIRKAGLRDDPPPGGLSIRERLAALDRWESAWDNPGILADPAAQHVIEIEDSDPDCQVMVVEDFYIEMPADGRAESYEYRYLDLRSSLQYEDVRTARHRFPQRAGLLCYAFAIDKYNMFAVLIEAPWLCNRVALQLLNFHDGKPHPFAARPIPITNMPFCIAKMHIIEDHILTIMTLDYPERPKSWITLVGLKDQSVTPIGLTAMDYFNDIIVLSHDVIALVNPVHNTLDLCRLDAAAATLHTQRKLELPPIYDDLSLYRASTTHYPSAKPPRGNAPSQIRPSPALPFYYDPARGIICIALHYTDRRVETSEDGDYDDDIEEQVRVLLVARRGALHDLAAAVVEDPLAHTSWRAWSPAAARALLHAEGPTAAHSFAAHATLHERLFLFTGAPAVAHLDFNPHRALRRVHGRCGACAREEGGGEDGRGVCRCGRESGSTVEGLRAEEEEGLPCRRTGIVLPEDSDAYFGTERIVRVVKPSQVSGNGGEGPMCRRVIVYPMTG
ncbi:hypothetical protein BJV78DRAFT_654647 [Lactifluus subvellereus]|nr:hypothetical protein BJV78DRAFT_654647 [Lactifluus subvellereus]